MTKRQQPTRTLRFAVSGVPAEINDEVLRRIIEGAVSELGSAAVATTPKVAPKRRTPIKRTPLYNRTTRVAGKFPCNRVPTKLMAAAIAWPAGAPHKGCGRVFTSEKRRDIHEAGTEWNAKVFPNGCLDRILPLSMRDTR